MGQTNKLFNFAVRECIPAILIDLRLYLVIVNIKLLKLNSKE